MSHAPVSVVVIHRNRADAIERTVTAFADQTIATRIIVVDNGSDPAAVEALPGLIGEAELVLTGSNLGFGPGGNVGIRRWLRDHDTDWLAIAPHDALPEPDTLERATVRSEGRTLSARLIGVRPDIDPSTRTRTETQALQRSQAGL